MATVKIQTGADWARLLTGLAAVFLLFQGLAGALHSERGEAGGLVACVVLVSLMGVRIWLFREAPAKAFAALGLGRPSGVAMSVAGAIGVSLVLVLVGFAQWTAVSLPFLPGWLAFLPGLFAQAGIAEETLFRAYLFGQLRVGRAFWRAAVLAMLPFVAVHLFLFFTLPPAVAAAAVGLSVLISFPLAYLFELGWGTVWAPALLHTVIQGALKVVVLPPQALPLLPVIWMAASAVLPYLAFAVRPRLTPAMDSRS